MKLRPDTCARDLRDSLWYSLTYGLWSGFENSLRRGLRKSLRRGLRNNLGYILGDPIKEFKNEATP